MKTIFLGSPPFAVPTLERLTTSRHEVAAVITQPDRPRNRGMQLAPPPVKISALKLGLRVMQPEKASSPSTLEEVRKLSPEAAVVVAYGQILKRGFLELPRFGCINLHPSLLPLYRGPTPIQAAILNGDRMTGVTTMLLDEGMDTGDILLQREVEISDDDTAGILHDKLAERGADLMVETLDRLETRSVVPRPQDEKKAVVTHKLAKEETVIDWSLPPEKIRDLVRAFNPWPGSRTTLGGQTLKIWKIDFSEDGAEMGNPGEVLNADEGGLIVQAGGGTVKILELQLSAGRRMSAAEFLRGHAIRQGSTLGK